MVLWSTSYVYIVGSKIQRLCLHEENSFISLKLFQVFVLIPLEVPVLLYLL